MKKLVPEASFIARAARRQRQCIRGAVAVLVGLAELTVVREEYLFWQKR